MKKILRQVFFVQKKGKQAEMFLKYSVIQRKCEQQIRPRPFGLRLCGKFSVFAGLRGHFRRHTGLAPAVFPLHPQLFQIKCQGQQKQLGADVSLASGQKATESKVTFKQAKCALHLNGAAKTQMDPTLGHNIFLCLFPLLPEGLPEHNLLGPVLVLGPAALRPVGAADAIFAPVPGGGHKLSVSQFCCLPSQMQLSALCAGKAVCLWVIFHVFNSAHLFAKLDSIVLSVGSKTRTKPW